MQSCMSDLNSPNIITIHCEVRESFIAVKTIQVPY